MSLKTYTKKKKKIKLTLSRGGVDFSGMGHHTENMYCDLTNLHVASVLEETDDVCSGPKMKKNIDTSKSQVLWWYGGVSVLFGKLVYTSVIASLTQKSTSSVFNATYCCIQDRIFLKKKTVQNHILLMLKRHSCRQTKWHLNLVIAWYSQCQNVMLWGMATPRSGKSFTKLFFFVLLHRPKNSKTDLTELKWSWQEKGFWCVHLPEKLNGKPDVNFPLVFS